MNRDVKKTIGIAVLVIICLAVIGGTLAFCITDDSNRTVTPGETEEQVDCPFTFDEKTSTTYNISYDSGDCIPRPDDTGSVHCFQHTSYFDYTDREQAVKYIYQHHGWVQDMGMMDAPTQTQYTINYVIWIEYV